MNKKYNLLTGVMCSSILTCTYCQAAKNVSEKYKWAKYGLTKSEIKSCIPDTRGKNDSWWIPYFKNKLKQARKDVLFLGDSITDLWTYPADYKYPGGLNTWNEKFKDIGTNFGLTGDKTQTVLWRLTEGKSLNEYKPKLIVLLIGINNLLQGDTPQDTAEGIKTIVQYLRKQVPGAKILLLGILPCRKSPQHPIREKIKETNSRISALDDGQNIYFVDIGHVFLEKDGSTTKKILRDTLHLSPKGYEIFAKALEPEIKNRLVK